MADRLALFTGGAVRRAPTPRPRTGSCATATREVVAVVDADVGRARRRPRSCPTRAATVPIVATVAEAAELGANVLVIGVAPFGGALTAEWRVALLEAIGAGMHVEAGLHTVLVRGSGAVRRGGRARASSCATCARRRPGSSVPAAAERPDVRVVHTVGSDCAIGKMSVTLELDAAARARGLESAFVATGPDRDRDHRLGDRRRPRDLGLHLRRGRRGWSHEGAARGAAAVRRGPGRARATRVLRRDARACCTAACPTCWCSATARARPCIDDYPGTPIPPLPELIAIYEAADRLGAARRGSARSRSTRAGWTTTRRARRSTRVRGGDRAAGDATRCASARERAARRASL